MLVVVVLMLLIAFVSLAVDVGRVRVAKIQLQTAADAAATAGASGLEQFPVRGVLEPQERAYQAAAANFAMDTHRGDGERIDSIVELVVDEDVVFGRWNDVTREFTRIERGSGMIDHRRQADAVRVWTRRVSRFEDADGNTVERGTALPLIFAPVVGVEKGEVWATATATLNGHVDAAGFVGLDFIRFSGAVKSDSYTASTESYPGANGANRNSSIASNGDITFTGAATILGSVYPGKNRWLMPQPLGGNIDITGHMFPLSRALAPVTPPYAPPAAPVPNAPGTIIPANTVSDTGAFAARGQNTRLVSRPQSDGQSTHFHFASWMSGGNDRVLIDNADSPVEIWINGAFQNIANAQIRIASALHPVTFHVNADMDLRGGGLVQPAGVSPKQLQIVMSGPGSTLRLGGALPLLAQVDAPLSHVNFTGNGSAPSHFYGRVVGKSLTVASNVELHYDESLGVINPRYQIRLVD